MLTKCSILFRMMGKTLSSLISASELHLSVILMLSLSPKGLFLLCPLAHLVIFCWKSDLLYLVSSGNRNEHSEVFCQYRWVLDCVSSFQALLASVFCSLKFSNLETACILQLFQQTALQSHSPADPLLSFVGVGSLTWLTCPRVCWWPWAVPSQMFLQCCIC